MIKLKDLMNEDLSNANALKIVNARLKQLGFKPTNKLTTWGGKDGIEYDVKPPKELKAFVETVRVFIVVQFSPNYDHRYNSDPGLELEVKVVQFTPSGLDNSVFRLYQKYSIKTGWYKSRIEKV